MIEALDETRTLEVLNIGRRHARLRRRRVGGHVHALS